MEESTPKKVHPRNSVCRLCGDAFESRYMLRIFGRAGKAGSDKNLASKIRNVCGIFVTESDSLSTLICRKCEGLLSKASEFRQRSQIMQMQLEQQCSVKRCVELSPSCKRFTVVSPTSRFAYCQFAYAYSRFAYVQYVSSPTPRVDSPTSNMSSRLRPKLLTMT